MRLSIVGIFSLACVLGVALSVHAQGSGSIKSPGSAQPGKVTEQTEIGGKDLKGWVKDLSAHDPSIRDRAMRAVLLYGKVATDLAGPALMERLRDPDIGMRSKTILALGIIGVPDKDVAKLVETLGNIVANEPQEIVRYNAAMVLAKLGPDAKAAVPKLAQAAGDALSWEVRKMCLFTLGEAAVDRKNGPDILAINAAMKGLVDISAEVRMEAATALYTLGTPTDDRVKSNVIGALKQRFVNEKDPEAIIWLYMAVIGIDGPKETWLKPLANFFKHTDPHVREQALTAAGMLGDQGKSITTMVNEALGDKEVPVVVAAIHALANIHRKDDRDKLVYREEWLKSLCRLFNDPNQSSVVREQAVAALGGFGEIGKPCAGDVVKALEDKDIQVVYAAIHALAKIGTTTEEVVAGLNGVQRREDLTGAVAEDVKRAAAQLVRNMKELKKPS